MTCRQGCAFETASQRRQKYEVRSWVVEVGFQKRHVGDIEVRNGLCRSMAAEKEVCKRGSRWAMPASEMKMKNRAEHKKRGPGTSVWTHQTFWKADWPDGMERTSAVDDAERRQVLRWEVRREVRPAPSPGHDRIMSTRRGMCRVGRARPLAVHRRYLPAWCVHGPGKWPFCRINFTGRASSNTDPETQRHRLKMPRTRPHIPTTDNE